MKEERYITLIERYKDSLKEIELPEKYKESALKFLEEWLSKEEFKEYVPQIEYMINEGHAYELLDSFYQVISFGTGGRRGKVGLGPNRINKWTIQSSAQGHSQYFLRQHGDEAKEKGVVLAYDVREFQYEPFYSKYLSNPLREVNCKNLALAAAEVYTANGFKVYMFKQPTPVGELSFAIRELGAIGGAMFSASHNPPTDNGKKVFDSNGGQLIPPHDEELVNEVTSNVKKIREIAIEEAEEEGLVEEIGEDLHEKYLKSVIRQSLSDNRSAKILYSPLHGTGRNSIYDVLKKAGFDIKLEESTSNFSGKFENVVFNIPNPEVEESFKTLLNSNEAGSVDLLINSDPDADRLGIMARESEGKWRYFNGNEIGILLTSYVLSKKESELCDDNLVVETCVTSSLISKIAAEYGVSQVNDLLVGFKYIADVMNKLDNQGKSDMFLLGAEESHGYIAGNYARDKDGAVGALLLSELASELKDRGSNLSEYLDEIYAKFGYCLNYLTEIRLLGAEGIELISKIQTYLRENDIEQVGGLRVVSKADKWDGDPFVSETDKYSRNVIILDIDAPEGIESIKITIRPSGTEPKIKMYFEILSEPVDLEHLAENKKRVSELRDRLEKDFMRRCYSVIDVDFPERGFLLFWQLPLKVKLKYFEIEDQITGLANIKSKVEREQKLREILMFLGTNPVEKVDKAFKNKYSKGIREFLDLD